MRGVKFDNMLAIVDFLYRGEAKVYQDNLDSFLAIAEELQLKGLVGEADENVGYYNVDGKSMPPIPEPFTNTSPKIPRPTFSESMPASRSNRVEESMSLALPSRFSGDLKELEERVKSMIGKSQNNLPDGHQKADVCKVCGKEGKKQNIKDHIETNHLEGIALPCNLCNKTFRSRNA